MNTGYFYRRFDYRTNWTLLLLTSDYASDSSSALHEDQRTEQSECYRRDLHLHRHAPYSALPGTNPDGSYVIFRYRRLRTHIECNVWLTKVIRTRCNDNNIPTV